MTHAGLASGTVTVTCAVTDHEAGLVAALSGTLTQADVAGLRLRLFKCLAEQPEALLVDLSGLTVADPLMLTVLSAVARQAARWPGTPVLLCAPTAPVSVTLADAAYRRLPVFASVEAAAADRKDRRRSLPSLSDVLLPISGAPRQARDMATEACLLWDVPELIGPAALIVSELISNVADHARTMATLRFTLLPHYLTIAAQDGSVEAPVPAPRADAERGRGLMLVQATAQSWGWMPTEGGKVVWASLAVRA